LEKGVEINCSSIVVEPLRIISSNNKWNEYIDKNDIYKHLEYVRPILERAKDFAKSNNINVSTPYLDKNKISFIRQKCKQPFKFLKITMDGNIYMCPQGYPANKNIREVDLVDLWNNEIYTSLRRKLDTENYDKNCWYCPLVQPIIPNEESLKKGLMDSSVDELANYIIVHRKYIKNCEEIPSLHCNRLHVDRLYKALKNLKNRLSF
ncbi:MAG: SPASM domain-containing protein, partial [Oligoflexia bacterium]|nr:SPASM domain-containing protein [Oligoflexia bacterium]